VEDIVRVEATEEYGIEKSELDQMWSYVGKKTNPRWLWHAIDRSTGQVLAYVLASEKMRYSSSLELLEPFGMEILSLMDGEPTNGICQQRVMRWVNGRPRR